MFKRSYLEREPIACFKKRKEPTYTPGVNHASWGVVIRDHQGSLVAARAGKIEGIQDAYSAEFYSLEQAVNAAVDVCAIRAVFETDSELLAIAMNRRGQDYSQLAASIDDLKIQLWTWFSHTEV